MDLRRLIHHQNHSQSHNQHHQQQQQPRYVHMPYPPQQSTIHYPDDPIFHNPRPQNPNYHYHQIYQHHQIHHLNVLQPQVRHHAPPPMPRPIHSQPSSPYNPPPPPPPPQYNPNQTQFTAHPSNQNLPFEIERVQRPSHWVLHRKPVDDDRIGRRIPELDHACSGNRSDIRDAYPHRDFDSDSSTCQFQSKTMSPYGVTDRFRHEAEGSSRFRGEYDVGFESKHREEVVRAADNENYDCRGQCILSSDVYLREPGLASNSSSSSRDLELKSGSYGGLYGVAYEDELFKRAGRDEVGKNQRWSRHIKAPRDVHSGSSFEKGCTVLSNGDGARIVTSKREYYGSESGRYGNSGSREVNHEFIRTPRKQVQKKSALLRIQKPNHKSTDSEQSYCSGYADNSNSSPFRRKDQRSYSGHGINEMSREASHVELDVSFKSNSLVAKAFVAPPNPSYGTDTELTFRNRKARKDPLIDKESSISEQTKLVDCIHDTSTSDKDSILSEGKNTTGNKNISDVGSKDCLSGRNRLLGKNKRVSMSDDTTLCKDGTKISSGILFSGTGAKKKKIAEKFVEPSLMYNSQTTKKDNELITTESCSVDPSAASDIVKGLQISSCPCPNEHVKKKAEGSAITTESTECSIDVNFPVEYVPKIDKDGINSNSHLGSSSQEKIIIDNDSENAANPYQDLHNVPISNKDLSILTEPLNATTITDDGCITDAKQSCQSGDTLPLESGSCKESSEVMSLVRAHTDSCLLNSEEMEMQKGLMNNHSSESCIDDTLGIVDGLTLSKEETINCDADAVTALSNQPCGIQISLSHKDDLSEELSEATYLAGTNATVGLSSLRETPKDAEYSIQGGGSFRGFDNVCSNYAETIVISNRRILDCISKKPSPDGATMLPENGGAQRSPNVKSSVEDVGGITCMIMKKMISTPLEFSRISDADIEHKDGPNSATSIDTTLNIAFEEPKNEDGSCLRSLDIGLQGSCPSKDGISALHENGSLDRCFEGNVLARDDVAGCSDVGPSHCRKRRKVSALDLSLSSVETSPTDKESTISFPSSLEAPLPLNVTSSHKKEEGSRFRTNDNNFANLMPNKIGTIVLAENKLEEGSSDALNAVSRSPSSDQILKFEAHGGGSILTHDVPTSLSFSSGPGTEQSTEGTRFIFVDNRKDDILNGESSRENNFSVSAPLEQDFIRSETAECVFYSDLQPPDVDVSLEYNNILVKDNLYDVPNYLSLPSNCGVLSTTATDEMEFEPHMIPDMARSQHSLDVSDVHILDAKASHGQMSTEFSRNDENLEEKTVVEVHFDAVTNKPFSLSTEGNPKSDSAVKSDPSTLRKTVPLPLKVSKGESHSLSIRSAVHNGLQKNQLGHLIPRAFPGHSATHAKPQTWHRDGKSSTFFHTGTKFPSFVTSKRQIPEKKGKSQITSYVRKGNSLVRKSPVAALPLAYHGSTPPVNRLNSARVDEMNRSSGSDDRFDVGTKLTSSVVLSGDFTPSLSAEPLVSGYCGSSPDSTRSSENNDTSKLVEDSLQASESVKTRHELNSSESYTELNDGNLASSNTQRIVYVKRKSNQLVAASNSCDLSLPNAQKMQASSFDGYYKKRKNQLIRTSLGSFAKQIVVMPNKDSKSEVQKATSGRRVSKTQLDKVLPNLCKFTRKSLVWTLCGTKSSANEHGSLDHQRVFPRLFPWKRTTMWRNFNQYRNLISETTSLSPITRKLLLSRKRDTIYIRSTNGYSLKKSKVLSVGGSSLKWSKSIEKRAKQANEEATLAVAAAKRKKRERDGFACAGSGSKSRKVSSRERIFRIGSVRYKMDSSRRTLQRISDDESSGSASPQPDKVARKSYIPRRLVIGNDEYVRIGNGNQLIRDPKKRTRLLASEKVRWSLHTIRLRLARKRKYCQFFTRFGKCNKDDGKCPYIHDPSKIAVCTKYLYGLCSNTNCKLTHKVIPERMPDCSYFLQGLCTNEKCPYRHVKVNPKASICEGFLRGYCTDGDECRKKHSYICPPFDATGTCSQGSKCKLHHPKNRTGGKKRKRPTEPKNARGRYFGSMHTNISDSRTSVSERHSSQDRSEGCLDGEGADFISIDVSDDESGESKDLMHKQTWIFESDLSELQFDDFDELIKPVRIMR